MAGSVDQLCGPCKDLGVTDSPAHYAGTPASRSTSGKEIPPKCRWHYFEMPLPWSIRKRIPADKQPAPVTPAAEQRRDEMVKSDEQFEPRKQETKAEKEKKMPRLTDEQRAQLKNCTLCGKPLRSDNTTGTHWKCAKASAEPRQPRKAKRKVTVSRTRPQITVNEGAEVATVSLPESYFDSWWEALSLNEKASAFSRQFES